MQRAFRYGLVLLALITVQLPWLPSAAAEISPVAAAADRQAILTLNEYLIWQRINEARQNPRAVLDRLGIPVETAQAVLGAEAWILDLGLPPVAWDDLLHGAAALHNRDMFSRLYYSHISPDGVAPMQRIAAAGYQAAVADETLGALVFGNYVAVEAAVDFIFDYILFDELTGTPGVARNVFSPHMTELGVSLFAESVPLLAGQPYVYLLVIDFAAPLEPRRFLVGTADPALKAAYQRYYTGFWDILNLLPGGSFQVRFPDGGADVVVYDDIHGVVGRVSVPDLAPFTNRLVNLRGVAPHM